MGNPQVINCTVSTVGMESSSVMVSWMGPGGGSITNDSRMIISPTTSSGNTYTSSLQFTYLMEGDEGTYTCNVMILENNGSQSAELWSLTSKYSTINTMFSPCTVLFLLYRAYACHDTHPCILNTHVPAFTYLTGFEKNRLPCI